MSRIRTIHRKLTLTLQAIMFLGFLLSIYQEQWLNTLLILAILSLSLLPHVLSSRMQIYIPPQLEMLAILFVFASVFLGEVGNYYVRFWWWDIVLHTGSGFLLGIFGFLLVYALNEEDNIDIHMKPRFVALFSFVFAVAIGAMWEMFEFVMDTSFRLNMQKEMLGDPSGLTDTMWDLIVDALGAATVSILGYVYLRNSREYWLERWIEGFIQNNPRLFLRK